MPAEDGATDEARLRDHDFAGGKDDVCAGWAVTAMDDMKKLERYEQMRRDMQAEYAQVCEQMDELKAKGLEKKAAFKTLMARKLTLREWLETYEGYGL